MLYALLSMDVTKRAFTLVEIMIALAIIGLLAVMAFPLFAKVRRDAVKSTVRNDAKQVVSAAQRYCMDKGVTTVPLTYIVNSSGGYIKQLSRGNSISVTDMLLDPAFTFEITNPFLVSGGLTFDVDGRLIGDPY